MNPNDGEFREKVNNMMKVFDEFMEVNPAWTRRISGAGKFWFCHCWLTNEYKGKTIKFRFQFDFAKNKMWLSCDLTKNDKIVTAQDVHDSTFFAFIKTGLVECFGNEVIESIPFVDPFALPFVLK